LVFQIKLKKWGLVKNIAYYNLTLKIDFKILVKYEKSEKSLQIYFLIRKRETVKRIRVR
jgi:hypothetical protein